MLLRHLIVLIIDARNAGSRLVIGPIVIGLERNLAMPHGTADFDRSDQINQNSRAVAFSPRGTGQTSSEASLYDVERSGSRCPKGRLLPNLLSLCDVVLSVVLVEPDGIEPTTSCLQSTRSPN